MGSCTSGTGKLLNSTPSSRHTMKCALPVSGIHMRLPKSSPQAGTDLLSTGTNDYKSTHSSINTKVDSFSTLTIRLKLNIEKSGFI